MLILLTAIYILGVIGAAQIIVAVTLGDTRPVVAALVWKYMLNDIFGIVNYIIDMLKLPIPKTWFASPDTAMLTLILFNVW